MTPPAGPAPTLPVCSAPMWVDLRILLCPSVRLGGCSHCSREPCGNGNRLGESHLLQLDLLSLSLSLRTIRYPMMTATIQPWMAKEQCHHKVGQNPSPRKNPAHSMWYTTISRENVRVIAGVMLLDLMVEKEIKRRTDRKESKRTRRVETLNEYQHICDTSAE